MFLHQGHGFIVRLGAVRRRATIFDEGDVVVEHEADRERVEDTHAGADAGNEKTLDSAGAEQHVEIGADERAVAVFRYDHFSWAWF